MKTPSLSETLRSQKSLDRTGRAELPKEAREKAEKERDERIERLQLELLKIQQGLFQSRRRAIIVFEGFDASGKGGCIRKFTEMLDPRGFRVHPIGPPKEEEQGTHWLYRFWKCLPPPGQLAIFDRSWYGRVLVERVDRLTPKRDWKRAYGEIAAFERMLTDDGVDLIKFYLGVSRREQLERFRERLENPQKRWKISLADVEARAKWDQYVKAADELLRKTSVRSAPWHVFGSDDKPLAHLETLRAAVRHLAHHGRWLESRKKDVANAREVRKALKQLR